MMNRMVKIEALLEARAMEIACVVLLAADVKTGGFANRVYQDSKL